MEESKLKCPKCAKPYQRGGKRFDDHVKACDGTPHIQKNGAAPAAPARLPSPLDGVRAAWQARREQLALQRDALDLEIGWLDKGLAALAGVKTICDRVLGSGPCQKCNEAAEKLREADWSRYDAETRRAMVADRYRKMRHWLREEGIRHVPDDEELDRMFPMVPVEPRPVPPKVADPRSITN